MKIKIGLLSLLFSFTGLVSIPSFANSLSNVYTNAWFNGVTPFNTVRDVNGNYLFLGYGFGNELDLDPTQGEDVLNPADSRQHIITKMNADGSYAWSRVIHKNGADFSRHMITNANGDVFIAARFWGAVDFDPTEGVDIHTSNCNSWFFGTCMESNRDNTDIFLTKINSDGSYGWTRTFGGIKYESVDGLAIDSVGDVYLTGSFISNMDFDPTEGIDNKVWTVSRDLNNFYNPDLFITKILSDGSYGGVKVLSAATRVQPTGIAVDANDNIFTIGNFSATVNENVDFDLGTGEAIRSSSGGVGFITKTDSSGNFLWVQQFDTFDLKKIDTDSSGNVYVMGRFTETADFDPSVGVDSHTSNGSRDVFVTKLNASGSYAWTETFGDIGYDEADALVVSPDGHAYVTGYLSDVLNVAGSRTIYIADISPNGVLLSTNEMQGSGIGRGYGITLDQNDNVYIAGSFSGTIDFEPGPGEALVTPPTYGGAFYAKYAPANLPPTAEAGDNQMAFRGQVVSLNGEGSYDDITATEDLQYSWSFEQLPADSTAAFDDASIQAPTFVADKLGTYLVNLVVTDEGGLTSTVDTLEVSSANVAPNANPGPGQGVYVGDLVMLDGSGSDDPNFDPLTYNWTLINKPTSPASTAALFDATTVAPYFTPDVAGEYEVELVVHDGIDFSAPQSVIITAVSAMSLINEARHIINNDIPSSCFKNYGDKTSMDKHLRNALNALANGNSGKAISDVTKAIKVTDGCVSNDPMRGMPDEENGPANTWVKDSIISCPHQELVYPLLEKALDGLQS